MSQPNGINLVELIEVFNSEIKCRAYLEALRWPDAVSCPECKSSKISRILKRNQFDCDSCRYQFSVTSSTIFHDTHLPLWKWFLCTYLLCESRKGMSTNQIKRTLGVSYKTAWYLCHRIRAAMKEANASALTGTVEMDETFVGGKPRVGRPHHPKEVVVGIRQRGGELRFFHAADVKAGTLEKYIRENISHDVDVLITDDAPQYEGIVKRQGINHEMIKHSDHIYVKGDIYTNTVESAFSLLKRGIIGTWHKVSAKHLASYLDEMTWRFNNRKNEFLFRDTIIKLIESPNLEYKELTRAA